MAIGRSTGAPRKLIRLIWKIFIGKKPMTDRDIVDWGTDFGSMPLNQISPTIERLSKLVEASEKPSAS